MVRVQKQQSLIMIVIIVVVHGGDNRTEEGRPGGLDDSDHDFVLEKSCICPAVQCISLETGICFSAISYVFLP